VSAEYLSEVLEAEARGRVAEIYEEIRRTVGSPVVNLVYRHLAVEPERLETVWSELRPNLRSPAARRLAESVTPPDIVAIPSRALAAIGVDDEGLAVARSTLDVYARANSRNLLGMQALLEGCPGGGDDRDEEPPRALPILPLADLSALPPATLALLEEMSAALVGGEEPRLVPSLLRHFADDAPLLALLWTAVRPWAAALEAQRLAVAAEARRIAGSLPYPVSRVEDPVLRGTARRFAVAMSTMLIAGESFRVALTSREPARARRRRGRRSPPRPPSPGSSPR
jgi:hypothetical protein